MLLSPLHLRISLVCLVLCLRIRLLFGNFSVPGYFGISWDVSSCVDLCAGCLYFVLEELRSNQIK